MLCCSRKWKWKLFRIFLIFSFLFHFSNATKPIYYDSHTFSDCFQGTPGWYNLAATCIFPLTQFERDHETAIKMCGAVNHSIGYRETNWLIAVQLLEMLRNNSRTTEEPLNRLYWTGLRVSNETEIGVEAEDATEEVPRISTFTSIFNPLWAHGQPPQNDEGAAECIALDLRNTSLFGWRALPCSRSLPVLCQNYACLADTFRCVDNSKCIPKTFVGDGVDDCLDGSDEHVVSTSASRIVQKTFDWPMRVSAGGVLSPSTSRYGRGECTHRWTILSPKNQHFVVSIKWLTPTSSTSIFLEGKERNGTILVTSRNVTGTTLALWSSSFVATALNTDTRRQEFQIFYQQVDPSECEMTSSNRFQFDSARTATSCHVTFTTTSPTSYVALLIHESTSPAARLVYHNNTTVTIPSLLSMKRLLVVPTGHVTLHINSTWPLAGTRLDVQFFELPLGSASPSSSQLSIFLIDRKIDIDWRAPRSEEVCMAGDFRQLSIHMIFPDFTGITLKSTWKIEKFRKTCEEDNVQLINGNQSIMISKSGEFSTYGPSSLIFHQSAEPFEFRATYSNPDIAPITTDLFLDEEESTPSSSSSETIAVNSTVATRTTTTTKTTDQNETICALPFVSNGYISSVSDLIYRPGTRATVTCLDGFSLSRGGDTSSSVDVICLPSGVWNGTSSEGVVVCQKIECPSRTPVEQTVPNAIPDTWSRAYGAVRRYSNLTARPFGGPFCVCGDWLKNEWKCWNTNYNGLPDACLLPVADDVTFLAENDGQPPENVIPTGAKIIMECLVCPTLKKTFVCQNGLWIDETSRKVQEYGGFGCLCSEEPGFVDPCAPYGRYVQYSGSYNCKCDNGYKFDNGTCRDIDECAEGSDWCDRYLTATASATCINLEPGFRCECPPGWQLFQNETHWQYIGHYLIPGYSCVESLCDMETAVNYTAYGLSGHWPSDLTPYFKWGSTTPAEYIDGLCDSEMKCVVPIRYVCSDGRLGAPDRDVLTKCPGELLAGLRHEGDGDFHVFSFTDVSCARTDQTLIGRNKVFCNSNAQWEMIPECIYESCSNLTQFVKWPLKVTSTSEPSGGEFTLHSRVEFGCDGDEYTLLGEPEVVCSRDVNGDVVWVGDTLPVCTRIGPSTATSSGTTSSGGGGTTTTGENTSSATFPGIFTTSGTSSRMSSTPFVTTVTPSRHQFDDDVVIENSIVFEETNFLEQRDIWMMSADWEWTSSGCVSHHGTSPASFLVTSTPIELKSSEIELVLDVSSSVVRLSAPIVQLSIFTSSSPFIPALSEFRTVINTTSSGSLLVKLRGLQRHLAVAVTVTSSSFSSDVVVDVCRIAIREPKCKEVVIGPEGVRLEASSPFQMRRLLKASCPGVVQMTSARINGVCDVSRGWVVQRTSPCLCNPKPPCLILPPQRDETGVCTLNSCSNGRCQQEDGYFICVCNDLFVRDVDSAGVSICRPDHCARTSAVRNSGYNCTTGLDDATVKCVDGQNEHGTFCQYSGTIYNMSYIYIQGNEFHPGSGSIAFATNICESESEVYAIPDVFCQEKPSPNRDVCSMCSGDSQCQFRNPPFETGCWCLCNEGDQFKNFGRNCLANDFCFPDHAEYRCENGGTCDAVSRVCHCLPDFSGPRCETLIITDRCYADEKTCGNGACRRENDLVYCNCEDGWMKDANGSCTIPWNMCSLNNFCQQSSDCNFDSLLGKQTCNCNMTDGWTGDYCEIQPHLDTCAVCANGAECLSSFTGHVRCQCALGWGSNHCDEKVNDCDFEPCLNGGHCQSWTHVDSAMNMVESYNCTCPQYYSGTVCEIYSVPTCDELIRCENGGHCEFDNEGKAICVCTAQFYGTRCEQNCSSICMYNSNGCQMSPNGTMIICSCTDGYTFDPVSGDCVVVNVGEPNVEVGKLEVFQDICKANLLVCENNGTCNHDTQACDCPEPFSGRYCDTNNDKCREVKCLNGATCLSPSGVCQCAPNFTGVTCENKLDACDSITCQNGGTCNSNNSTCTCIPGTTGDRCQYLGQPCVIRINGVDENYCLNGGTCTVIASGATCACNGTNYTGRRCEINAASYNFNLVFNGLDYSPDIVSTPVTNSTIQEFTLCTFVQYNHPSTESLAAASAVQNDVSLAPLPPYLSFRGYGSNAPQMVFDNNGFFLCYGNRQCSRAESNSSDWKSIPITANTWHHFCVVSPISSATAPSYTAYLDGVQVVSGQLAEKFNPGLYAYIYLAPSNITRNDQRFEGMISITQLYSIRLTEAQIGQLAFDCDTTLSNSSSVLNNNATVPIRWNGGFTRVSSSNPGVYVDPAGICRSVKCMFGRQVKGVNNYNSTYPCNKDRIAPTVLRCPGTIYRNTTEDFTAVSWPEESISFFDNIGVIKIDVNFMNGQQFGVGITAVRYVAFDAAGNTAECTFDVVVTQRTCPTRVTVAGGSVSWVLPEPAGPYAPRAAQVKCTDSRWPSDTRPRFYTCDLMGSFQYGGWTDGSKQNYYLPPCGDTINALQTANGAAVGQGSCSELYHRLRDIIWNTVQCDVIKSCNLTITPPCTSESNQTSLNYWMDTVTADRSIALQYFFTTGNASETISDSLYTAINSTFGLVTMTSTVKCPDSHPIPDTSNNNTFCVSCPAGTFADETRSKCVDCPVDTYRTLDSVTQLQCDPCPGNFTTGTMTGAVGEYQCYNNCGPGQYEVRGRCLPCPEGTFGDKNGLRKCTCCGFDLSTFGDGKTNFEDCNKMCQPGQEMVRSFDSPVPRCVDCPKGYYKTGERGACLQCPRGLTTQSTGSKLVDECSVLDCIEQNTMRNENVTAGHLTPYSEMCIACEQGQFQNVSNQNACIPCSELADDVTELPVTCQSTCTTEVPVAGCNCQLQKNATSSKNGGSSLIIRNCLAEVSPTPADRGHKKMVAIVLGLVFGILLLVIVTTLVLFRKQIYAWFRKTDSSDNQHVAPSHWDRPVVTPTAGPHDGSSIRNRSTTPAIPRPNLRIVTSREELAQLPALPPSTPPPFHVDSGYRSSSGVRQLGTTPVLISTVSSAHKTAGFEANGSPLTARTPRAASKASDDSSVDSDFF